MLNRPLARNKTLRKLEKPSSTIMPLKAVKDWPVCERVMPSVSASPTAASRAVQPLRVLGMNRSTSKRMQAQTTRMMFGRIV